MREILRQGLMCVQGTTEIIVSFSGDFWLRMCVRVSVSKTLEGKRIHTECVFCELWSEYEPDAVSFAR